MKNTKKYDSIVDVGVWYICINTSLYPDLLIRDDGWCADDAMRMRTRRTGPPICNGHRRRLIQRPLVRSCSLVQPLQRALPRASRDALHGAFPRWRPPHRPKMVMSNTCCSSESSKLINSISLQWTAFIIRLAMSCENITCTRYRMSVAFSVCWPARKMQIVPQVAVVRGQIRHSAFCQRELRNASQCKATNFNYLSRKKLSVAVLLVETLYSCFAESIVRLS